MATGFANTVNGNAVTGDRERTVEETLGETVVALESALRRLEEMESMVGPAKDAPPPPVGIVAMAVCAHGQAEALNSRLVRLAERLGRL